MLDDVVLAEGTWTEASDARRAEFRAVAAQLLAAHHFGALTEPAVLRVALTEQQSTLALVARSGAVLAEASVPHDVLAKLIGEYVDVVRRIAQAEEGFGSARIEVLDMAKKVVHDDAGRTVERACEALGVDHATSRRLFTLLLTLRVDTTKLLGIHGHRPIR